MVTQLQAKIEKPSWLSESEFNNLNSEDKRFLPHPMDIFIIQPDPSWPKGRLPMYQVDRKLKPHGALAGLPFRVTEKNSTNSNRTLINNIEFSKCVAHIPLRDQAGFIDDGQ